MSRRYFKKNVDQFDLFDLFDLAAQLSDIKEFRSAEAELTRAYRLRQAELNLIETKKKSTSKWTQVSIESIFDDML